MQLSTPQGEICPANTVGDPTTVDYASPLLLTRLRQYDREPIPPELCRLGPDCLVCRWRREGLLDLRPDSRAA